MCVGAYACNTNPLHSVLQIGVAMGFHWEPTLKQLHMHCISRDFSGTNMSRASTWRSFCSEFFRPVDRVRAELAADGRVAIDFAAIAALRKAPVQCPRCGKQQRDFPSAQRHLEQCSGSGAWCW